MTTYEVERLQGFEWRSLDERLSSLVCGCVSLSCSSSLGSLLLNFAVLSLRACC
jgi:hypothetical protein